MTKTELAKAHKTMTEQFTQAVAERLKAKAIEMVNKINWNEVAKEMVSDHGLDLEEIEDGMPGSIAYAMDSEAAS